MRRNQFRRVFHPVNAKTPQESRMLRPVSLLIVTLAWSVIVFLLVTGQVMSPHQSDQMSPGLLFEGVL